MGPDVQSPLPTFTNRDLIIESYYSHVLYLGFSQLLHILVLHPLGDHTWLLLSENRILRDHCR